MPSPPPDPNPLQPSLGTLRRRLGAFVAERHPHALELCLEVFDQAVTAGPGAGDLEELARRVADGLTRALQGRLEKASGEHLGETIPGVTVAERLGQARDELVAAVTGCLRREILRASLTADERRELLRGMLLTRAADSRLKTLFTSGELRFENRPFQGKGFRSLGQEAVYGAALRLRRGESHRRDDGSWGGDVVAPLIRDAGVALAMDPSADGVFRLLNAQGGKAGPPMDGKDLHLGDFSRGILPPTAPLSIATATVTGLALAMQREEQGRIAVAFIGEGGSSLGEWHEALNFCAARHLPAVFCVENNQTALSTPVHQQAAVRTFADRGLGHGVPACTVDGTDPEAIAAAFAWAALRARQGVGPTLVELVALRICGHAHHDDSLYLGHDPRPGWGYPELREGGYGDPEAFRFWAPKDPLVTYPQRLMEAGLLTSEELEALREEVTAVVDEATERLVAAPWPEPAVAGRGVLADEPRRRHVEILDQRPAAAPPFPELPKVEAGSPFDPDGATFLEALTQGIGEGLRHDPEAFVLGQDVGAPYGNAFLLLRPLLDELGERIVNAPLAESAILGAAVGSALAGMHPVAEIQFNDFVATGFNQLVNNAAMLRYRWGASVPMVVRLPWGGLRSAGPFHSQNTEAWLYRVPGLKIVAPSTPEDARALFLSALADPDPVLFYEHIALYRDPRRRQRLEASPPLPGTAGHVPLGRAALRRAGSDLAILSYGASVHLALEVAEELARDGAQCSVLDLRSLAPLDLPAALAVAGHCGRVLIVHEDHRTGGIGESLAAKIQEQAFEYLDAPVRILGALDTPVPYSPPLEREYLPGKERMATAARKLLEY
ncbi:MAG: thiamine pyrophosphate-dependent enzyme [Acidobacteriota bacterium]|nr:thiamine pyrophosphate-dependent enzyme [Acidobacteriota bacterium]